MIGPDRTHTLDSPVGTPIIDRIDIQDSPAETPTIDRIDIRDSPAGTITIDRIDNGVGIFYLHLNFIVYNERLL